MRYPFLILLSIFLFSCSKNNEPKILLSQWNITNIDGQAAAKKNEPVSLTVYWPFSSGCDILDKFESSQQGNIIIIKAYGHTSGGICTMNAGIKTKVYTFTPSGVGNFELRFISRDSSIISHLITVN
ncbi:MAG: hypothetical protein ABIP30_07290 [Ferruginibacter sp.]